MKRERQYANRKLLRPPSSLSLSTYAPYGRTIHPFPPFPLSFFFPPGSLTRETCEFHAKCKQIDGETVEERKGARVE